jgi:pyruvate/2-oxoglutarate dehydrogenase complex dihydrolipoamide dehydrogenase (E3) component
MWTCESDTGRLGAHIASADTTAVPRIVFSDSEAGTVGLTLAQAERAGHWVRAVDVDTGQVVAGANLCADGHRGRGRMVVDL